MQMPEEELIQLKFRIYDGTDIGPFRYSPSSTVATLKDRVVSDWPKGCSLPPYILCVFSFRYSVSLCKLVFSNLCECLLSVFMYILTSKVHLLHKDLGLSILNKHIKYMCLMLAKFHILSVVMLVFPCKISHFRCL